MNKKNIEAQIKILSTRIDRLEKDVARLQKSVHPQADLKQPLSQLLSKETAYYLEASGIRTLRDLSQASESEVKAIRRIGKNRYAEIQQMLEQSGLGFAKNVRPHNPTYWIQKLFGEAKEDGEYFYPSESSLERVGCIRMHKGKTFAVYLRNASGNIEEYAYVDTTDNTVTFDKHSHKRSFDAWMRDSYRRYRGEFLKRTGSDASVTTAA